jgi:hypothetical protein
MNMLQQIFLLTPTYIIITTVKRREWPPHPTSVADKCPFSFFMRSFIFCLDVPLSFLSACKRSANEFGSNSPSHYHLHRRGGAGLTNLGFKLERKKKLGGLKLEKIKKLRIKVFFFFFWENFGAYAPQALVAPPLSTGHSFIRHLISL